MKLAEALSIRKDLQKRIEQLKSRLENTVKVQEGEQLHVGYQHKKEK